MIMFRISRGFLLSLLLLLAIATPGLAQDKNGPQIDWQKGPTTGDLGGMADIKVPEGYLFAGKAGAQTLLDLTHNIPSGRELGVVVPASNTEQWFVIFEFDSAGYVKDDEKDKIDAAALLESIQEGTEASNEARKEKGWEAFHVAGWEKPPFYDTVTNNLTWAIRGKGDSGGESVNHSIRLLGRRGTMSVDVVLAPEEYGPVVDRFNTMMSGFSFREGSRYQDFVAGDKVAAYGLTALIAGGAGAVAVKTGFLAKMWKVIVAAVLALKKVLIVAVIALAAAIKRLVSWLRGRREQTATSSE